MMESSKIANDVKMSKEMRTEVGELSKEETKNEKREKPSRGSPINRKACRSQLISFRRPYISTPVLQ